MGVSLRGKYHGDYSPFGLDMGYSTFFRLRCVVCKNFSQMLYDHYKTMNEILYAPQKEQEKWDRKTERIIELQKLEEGRQKKILDFLFAVDCKGKISYGTCKNIYEYIKNEPDTDKYGYVGRKDCSTMGDFKKLLLDVYENKGNLIWH